jgi:hypothetical protein
MVVRRRQAGACSAVAGNGGERTDSEKKDSREIGPSEEGDTYGVGSVHNKLDDSEAGLHESALPSHHPWSSWASPLFRKPVRPYAPYTCELCPLAYPGMGPHHTSTISPSPYSSLQ